MKANEVLHLCNVLHRTKPGLTAYQIGILYTLYIEGDGVAQVDLISKYGYDGRYLSRNLDPLTYKYGMVLREEGIGRRVGLHLSAHIKEILREALNETGDTENT